MKKGIVIALIVGFLLMIVGICVSKFNFNEIFNSINEANMINYEKKEYVVKNTDISTVYIDTNDESVIILPSDDDTIKIIYYDEDKKTYTISEDNGKLSMIVNRTYNFLNFGYTPIDINVKVYIPKDLIVFYDINTSNSKIEINSLEAENIKFKTSNGKIVLDKIISNKINLKTSNSKIVLNEVKANEINGDTNNGKLDLNNINCLKLDFKTSNSGAYIKNVKSRDKLWIKTSNGNINYTNSLSNDINLKTSNSNVTVNIGFSISDYNKDFKTSNDSIKLNNYRLDKHFIEKKDSDLKFNIKTSNGNIKINSKED